MRRSLSCITLSLALVGTATCAAQALPSPAVTQGKPGTIAVATGGITYFAQGGDTLMSVAQAYTGRRENWIALGRINRIDRDISIPIGTGIVIPADLLIDEGAQATVATMSGSSRATAADGTAVALSIGMRIGEGVEIETGANSFLTLALSDASRISVPSNSRLRLAKLRVTRYTGSPRTEVMLLRGRVESRVAPLDAVKGKFEVRTPQSVAGVRGTRFRVGIAGTGVTHEVLSGSVAAESRKQAETLMLAAGRGAIVGATHSGTAVDLLPAPQVVVPETSAIYPAARFTVTPQADASAYHIQISTDHEALNVIAESRSAQPQLAVEGLRDGQYFMHVSALDRAGLEGLVRTQAFTLKQQQPSVASSRVAAPAAPYVERSDARSVTLRWAAQPGLRYQLQIARDADFSWLIHSAATDLPEATVPRPPFGTYYARVQMLAPDGRLHASSNVQPFVVTDHWVLNDGTPVKAKEPARGAPDNAN
jgi:hypothetical protein